MLEKILVFVNLLLLADSVKDWDGSAPLQLSNNADDQLLRVIRTSEDSGFFPLYQNLYYSVSYRHKSKRRAYEGFKERFAAISRVLQDQGLISDAALMPKSRIKLRFIHRTREWEFRRSFAFPAAGAAELLLSQIEEIGAKTIVSVGEIIYLDGKWLEALILAEIKQSLEEELRMGGWDERGVTFECVKTEGLKEPGTEESIEQSEAGEVIRVEAIVKIGWKSQNLEKQNSLRDDESFSLEEPTG